MPCYHPIAAYKTACGSVVFSELKRYDILHTLSLPCGQCVGCRLEYSRQWAVRCLLESSLHDANCFVTLTYDDENLPPDRGLRYRDFQLFMKRLRKRYGNKVRFYMCGEYGPLHGRPHYHACLFNHDFSDRVFWQKTPSGSLLYTSDALAELWPHGFSSVGDVTFESAAYVARYIMKKITGDMAKVAYAYTDDETGEIGWVEPEFCHMSLKPGIGAEWLEKFACDVFPHDRIVVRGVEMSLPKYFDKLIERSLDWLSEFHEVHVDHEMIKHKRERNARIHWRDNTPERLAVRETVAKARLNLLSRSVE